MRLLGSVKRMLYAGMAGLLVLILAMALTSLNAIRSLDREGQENLVLVATTTRLALRMTGQLAEQVRNAEAYLVAPDPSLATALVGLGDSVHAAGRRFSRVEGLTAHDLETLNRISDRQSQLETGYARAHALFDLGRTDEARRLALTIHPVVDSLLDDVEQLTIAQANLAEQRAEVSRINARQRQIMLWLLVGSAVLVGSGIAAWSVRSIDGPLSRLLVATGRFGDGDLRPTDLGTMPEELHLLARSINRMGGRLRGVVDAVIGESRDIATSAGDFSAVSQQLAANSSQVATEMFHIATAAERQADAVREAEQLFIQLREGVGRNAVDSEAVVDMGERIRTVAEFHRRGIEQAASTLLVLRQVVQASASDLGHLSRGADAMRTFTDTVQEIGNRCGVLAVNASIEIARLGDAGAGMKVIAEEMETLARRCGTEVDQAERAVESIRSRVAAATANLETGSARVLSVEATAKRAAGALEEIIKAVDDVGIAARHVAQCLVENRQIVSALANRTSEIDRIARTQASASEAVTESSKEQNASTEEIAGSAQGLFEAAQRLQALVADFKT